MSEATRGEATQGETTRGELTKAPAVQGGVAARITFSVSGVVVDCPAGVTVLAAAKAAGLKLPFNCGKGVCGTCKSKLTSGTVAMKHGGGIRPRDVAAGLILTCCSQPLEDLVIER